ncbi:hypothetical protein PUN28_006205 [Cardiocondyla obscurior]|uniref:Uncharacterized protein n=1 Tax=Cardiocondyla obscurior TaxID=286306 RepID=A0AAW2G9Q7_9HYME
MNFQNRPVESINDNGSNDSGGDEGKVMADGNVSVPEVALFYSCSATSGLAQTPCTEYDQFPYAKRRSDVEQSGIAQIRHVARFSSAAANQPRSVRFQY